MHTLRLVAGSIVVYAIVACGSAAVGPSFGEVSPDASVPRVTDAASMGVALADALVNPVPEASAQVAAPIVATEACNKTGPYGGSATITAVYAEHAFPGFTATQLAAVRVLITTSTDVLPGYAQQQDLAYVRDGYAAVYCWLSGDEPDAGASVTFILPQ
jgi:hypothetical protein